jgi:hypothetical protein
VSIIWDECLRRWVEDSDQLLTRTIAALVDL